MRAKADSINWSPSMRRRSWRNFLVTRMRKSGNWQQQVWLNCIAKVLGFALVGTTRAKPVWRKSPEQIQDDSPRICLPFIWNEKRVSVAPYAWATILAGEILHESIKDGRLERALQERTDDRYAAHRAFVEVVDRINMSAENHSGESGTPER
jgi:hypothetical protein